MSVVDVCPTRVITGQWTPGYRSYKVTYKVTTTSSNDGPQVVMSQSGKFLLGTTYQVGNDIDTGAICVALGAPRRTGNDKNATQWLLDATFEFDQTQLPYYHGISVEPYFVQTQSPIEAAKFLGFYKVDTNGTYVPASIVDPILKVGIVRPISNSAGIPIIPVPETEVSIPAYRVSWTKRTAFDVSDYLNRVNSVAVELQSIDRTFISPATGEESTVLFSKFFAAGTLRLIDCQMTETTFYGRVWHNVTLEFVEDTIDTYELDRGLAALARAGYPDARGAEYGSGEFEEGQPEFRVMTDPNGNPMSEPSLLDGRGLPLEQNENADNAIYLRWQKYQTADFNDLEIGLIT